MLAAPGFSWSCVVCFFVGGGGAGGGAVVAFVALLHGSVALLNKGEDARESFCSRRQLRRFLLESAFLKLCSAAASSPAIVCRIFKGVKVVLR